MSSRTTAHCFFGRQHSFTIGRIIVAGGNVLRGWQGCADYLVYLRRGYPPAVVEDKEHQSLAEDGAHGQIRRHPPRWSAFSVLRYRDRSMVDDALTQSDAEALLRMEKVPAAPDAFQFPDMGGRIEVPLVSRDERERFSLDINRKRITLTTGYQMRGRQVIVLARLDFSAPHRNPDGAEVGVPHLHLYREGYGDKWAVELPEGLLSEPGDAWQVLHDFMTYCGVVERPNIVRGLFS